MRPAGQAKAGFFETPTRILKFIRQRLVNPPNQPARLLDPCAGDGIPAHSLAQSLSPCDPYVIELDKGRANQCASLTPYALRSDAMVCTVQRDAFNLLFLNPPYDSACLGKRTEFTWLKRWISTLQPNGILVYIIPEHQYTEQVLELVSTYIRDVSLFRFPTPEYERFQQTVLFGRRAHSPNPSHGIRQDLSRLIRSDTIPTLDDSTTLHTIYQLPPLLLSGSIHFNSKWIDPHDMYDEATSLGVWKDSMTCDLLRFEQSHTVRPLMPLRIGHLTRMIVAGMFNNHVVEQQGRHLIIKGRGRKRTRELPPLVEEVKTKEGPKQITHFRTIEQHVPEIRAWDITEGPTFGCYLNIAC